MKIENKEILLYSMNKAYNSVKKVLACSGQDENEAYYRIGTCLHWIIDCYDRLPEELQPTETKEFFLGLRGINNCLKHNKMLKKIQGTAGGIDFPFDFAFDFANYYVWESLDYIIGMKEKQRKAYQKLLYGRKIDNSLKKAVNYVNTYYEGLE